MDTSPSSELMTTPVSAYQHATSGVRRSFDASGAHGGQPKPGATLCASAIVAPQPLVRPRTRHGVPSDPEVIPRCSERYGGGGVGGGWGGEGVQNSTRRTQKSRRTYQGAGTTGIPLNYRYTHKPWRPRYNSLQPQTPLDLVTQKAANESAQQTCQVCVCRRCCGAIDLKFFAPHAPWQIPLELVSISAAHRTSAPLPGVHAED